MKSQTNNIIMKKLTTLIAISIGLFARPLRES